MASEGSPQKNVQEAKQKGEGKELELAMITVGQSEILLVRK